MNASPSTGDHIVKSYDDELKRLTGEIQRMGEIALAQLNAAIDAVMERDSETAMRIVQSDSAVDTLEHDVSQDVVRLLALRQPIHTVPIRCNQPDLRVPYAGANDLSTATCCHNRRYDSSCLACVLVTA